MSRGEQQVDRDRSQYYVPNRGWGEGFALVAFQANLIGRTQKSSEAVPCSDCANVASEPVGPSNACHARWYMKTPPPPQARQGCLPWFTPGKPTTHHYNKRTGLVNHGRLVGLSARQRWAKRKEMAQFNGVWWRVRVPLARGISLIIKELRIQRLRCVNS